jgi:hypothetical protein
MLDWFVLLTPLLVFPIVLLFLFLGCGSFDTEPAAATADVQLNPASNINDIVPNGTNYKVASIKVTFTLHQKPPSPGAAVATPKPIQKSILPKDPARTFVDPALDGSVAETVPAADLTTYNEVECVCAVTLRPTANPQQDVDNFTTPSIRADLEAGKKRVFRLDPVWDKPGPTAKPRRFRVVTEI